MLNQEKISQLAENILEQPRSDNRPFIIGISGFGGSGKTTLAAQLSAELQDTQIIHVDDFIIKESLYEPLENWECFDRKRLERQVLKPAREGRPIHYQKLLWHENKLGLIEELPSCSFLIVEGISIWHPGLEKYYDFRIWVDVDPTMAAERGRQREDGNRYAVYWDLWRQNEARYLRKYHQDKLADYTFDNNSG